MGLNFGVLHIAGVPLDTVLKTVAADMHAHGYELAAPNAQNDCVKVVVIPHKEWITVASEVFDFPGPELSQAAKRYASNLKSKVLALSCYDSDWAEIALYACGKKCGTLRVPEGGRKAPDGHRYARPAWLKAVVKDVAGMARIDAGIRVDRLLADEVLTEVGSIIGLEHPALGAGHYLEELPAKAQVMRFLAKPKEARTDSVGSKEDAPPHLYASNYSEQLKCTLGSEVNYRFDVALASGKPCAGIFLLLSGPALGMVDFTQVEAQTISNSEAALTAYPGTPPWFDAGYQGFAILNVPIASAKAPTMQDVLGSMLAISRRIKDPVQDQFAAGCSVLLKGKAKAAGTGELKILIGALVDKEFATPHPPFMVTVVDVPD